MLVGLDHEESNRNQSAELVVTPLSYYTEPDIGSNCLVPLDPDPEEDRLSTEFSFQQPQEET